MISTFGLQYGDCVCSQVSWKRDNGAPKVCSIDERGFTTIFIIHLTLEMNSLQVFTVFKALSLLLSHVIFETVN